MKTRVLTATIAAIAVASFVGGAEAKSRTCVEVVKSQDVTMEKGKAHVYVVKMNGQTMVAIPAEMVPDPLHQQLFTYQ